MEQSHVLGPRWTKRLLESCTPKELLVIISAYSAEQVARRMGFPDIEQFARERRVEIERANQQNVSQ